MNILGTAVMALSFNAAVPKIYPDSAVQKYVETNYSMIQELKKKHPLVDETDLGRIVLTYNSVRVGGISGFAYWNNSADGKYKPTSQLIKSILTGKRDSVDCDESSSLLVALLRAQGYDAHLYVPFQGHVIVRVRLSDGMDIFMDPSLGGFNEPGGGVYDYYFSSVEVKNAMIRIDRYYTTKTLPKLDIAASNVSTEIPDSSIHKIVEKINILAELSPELYAAFICSTHGFYYDLSYDPFRDAMKKTYAKKDFEATIKAYSIYFGVDENTLRSLEAVGYTWAVRFMVWLCQYGTDEQKQNPTSTLDTFLKLFF
ncbi:MAG: hypothetical protein QXY05_01660 [Candidatus Anstonellales archaeon]